jgi:hypothetical protein
LSTFELNVDLPTLKRRFEDLQEETSALEAEYEEMLCKRKAKEDLLKKITEWEDKKLAFQAKINELKDLDMDLFSR